MRKINGVAVKISILCCAFPTPETVSISSHDSTGTNVTGVPTNCDRNTSTVCSGTGTHFQNVAIFALSHFSPVQVTYEPTPY